MRRKNDFYETNAYAVIELLRQVPIRGVLFECCAGKGAISLPLREYFPTYPILTNDKDVSLPAGHHFDASKSENWERFVFPNETIDWTITNPPFSTAFKILVNAYDHSKLGVAFLLRLSFLEPTYQRQDWLDEHPPDKLIVLPRFSFTGDGKTDSVTCAWMVWDKASPWSQSHAITISRKR